MSAQLDPPTGPAICPTCDNRRAVVIANITAELRRAGHPYTVLGPCPVCAPLLGLDPILPELVTPSDITV